MEQAWVPVLQGSEERDSLSGTDTAGDGTVSENEEENPQQEGPEQVEPHGTVSGLSNRNISQRSGRRDTYESQSRPERQQRNQPRKMKVCPIPKPNVISQMERREELEELDLRGSEEREILKHSCPGDWTVSKKENSQKCKAGRNFKKSSSPAPHVEAGQVDLHRL
ncbi:uncharacterized protein LOC102946970 isoform X6 [Chelonia mydas]|uniref:uncharacterized protein LOC102946970 isoform X6 n=1 Tax=Chelonia mydas TaxID=8469 RepID=UPI001CA93C67|nr:uncharacterized protein LOC102946970 isoform X6 [Chelonia mydas]